MHRDDDKRTLLRYVLAQIPGLALLAAGLLLLRRVYPFPAWILWAALALWLAKDAALYPVLRRSFESFSPQGAGSLNGARGIACERLEPAGYIRVRGELWRAELADGTSPVEKGEEVVVRNRRGLTLLVESLPTEAPGTRIPGRGKS